ncbi:MAG: hypothetical protein K8T20_12725, partial [Planctomycetes bacterium]|nr:hypothetical protein [Planctomycetota bacterium]
MTHPTPDAEPLAPAESESGSITGWVESQVRNTPWWLISIAFHLIVLAGMTVVTFKENIKTISEPVIIPVARIDQRLTLPDRPVDMFQDRKKGFSTEDMQKPSEDENDDVVLPPWDAEESNHNETDNDMTTHTMKGDSMEFLGRTPGTTGGIGRGVGGPGTTDVVGVGDGGGSGGMHGDPFGGGNRNCRKVGPSGNGTITRETEDAVKRGLWWLGRHQNANGSWSAENFNSLCQGGKCNGTGYNDYDAGETGLALLAYLGAGYTHLSREKYIDPISKKTMVYGDAVKGAVKWLMANQDAEGCFGGRHGSKYMYNHAIAALAMAEAFGLTGSSLFHDSAQHGIDFLTQAQNPYKAWRYSKLCGD